MLVVCGVVIIVFVVSRLLGNPVDVMLPLTASAEQRIAFAHELGLDQPISVQFKDYARDVFTGNFGESLSQRRPAMEIVFERLPMTLTLVFSGIALSAAIAIPVGIFAAMRPGSLLDKALVSLSLVSLSMPQFWLGLLLILVFGVRLGWFPVQGTGSLSHLVLPMVVVAASAMAKLTMVMRTSMIDELNSQHIKWAKARNLSRRRIIGVHALRNASIPVLTMFGWELVQALAGYTVVVETVFAWPGLGFTAMEAINQHDFVLLQAIVFTIAIIIIAINILIDVAYHYIDRRIKLA